MYKVYVAAVNGAGQGEWQETDNVISTEGVGESIHTHLQSSSELGYTYS